MTVKEYNKKLKYLLKMTKNNGKNLNNDILEEFIKINLKLNYVNINHINEIRKASMN